MLLPAWLDGRWIVREAHPCLCCFQWAMCNQRLVGCLTFQCKRLSTCRFAFWFLCSLSFLIDSMGQAWDTTYKYITKSKKRRKKKKCVDGVWMTVSLHARFRFASAFDLYERMYCVVMLCSTWQYKYDCMEIGQWAVRGKRHTHTHTRNHSSPNCLQHLFVSYLFVSSENICNTVSTNE